MQNYSDFQLANPLSTKKFTKKMIGSFIGNSIAAIFFVYFGFYLKSFNSSQNVGFDSSVIGYGFLICMLFAFILMASLIIKSIYIKAYIKRYYYDAGDQFVTFKKGVFTPTEIHIQYGKIQDVYVNQDLIDRMLGIFDVHIASATSTSGIEAHIDGVDKDTADRIKSFFLGKIGSNHTNTNTQTTKVDVPISIHLTSEISSKTYPPSHWYLVNSIFISLITTTIFTYVVLLQGRFSFDITVLIIIIALVISTIRNIIWFNNYFFSFDKDMIVKRTKVISSNETHVPYSTIQDVVFTQSIFQRIFGLATVTIQNATQTQIGLLTVRDMSGATSNGIDLIAQPTEKARELVEIVRGIIGNRYNSRTGL